MAFKLRTNLRAIPARTLMRLLTAHDVKTSDEVWKSKGVAGLAVRVADALLAAPNADVVLADLVRAAALASPKGQVALLASAPNQADVGEAFAKLENEEERALWFLLEHPSAFETAEMRHFHDHHAERQFARHLTAPLGLPVSRAPADVNAVEVDLAQHFRKSEGSGLSCRGEFVERAEDGSIQIALFVQGLPTSKVELVDRQYSRRISHPAIEAAVTYRPSDGHVTTIIRGGAPAHEVLRESFAKNLLKTTAAMPPLVNRPFSLDGLLRPKTFVPEIDAGLAAVRLRGLKLVPRNGDGFLMIEAPAGDPDVSVYDLMASWFSEGTSLLHRFHVKAAKFTFHFLPTPGRATGRNLSIELGYPNTSNLKELEAPDRAVAEAHIAKFGLADAVTR